MKAPEPVRKACRGCQECVRLFRVGATRRCRADIVPGPQRRRAKKMPKCAGESDENSRLEGRVRRSPFPGASLARPRPRSARRNPGQRSQSWPPPCGWRLFVLHGRPVGLRCWRLEVVLKSTRSGPCCYAVLRRHWHWHWHECAIAQSVSAREWPGSRPSEARCRRLTVCMRNDRGLPETFELLHRPQARRCCGPVAALA